MAKPYTIEISKVTDKGKDLEFVIGYKFADWIRANQVYNELDNKFQVEPLYSDGDYLVELFKYHDDSDPVESDCRDLLSTFVTNEYNAKMIDNLYFKQ